MFLNPQRSTLVFSPIVIPLKSELAYKILERGRMRFWLQAEEISSKVTYKFFANNKELSGADVRYTVVWGMNGHRDFRTKKRLSGFKVKGLSALAAKLKREVFRYGEVTIRFDSQFQGHSSIHWFKNVFSAVMAQHTIGFMCWQLSFIKIKI